MRGLTLALLITLAVGCREALTGPTDPPDPSVSSFFEQGRADLISRGVPSAQSARIEQFSFQAVEGPFDCGDVRGTQGCFLTKGNIIRYGVGHEYVVRHEAKHAILHALGDSRWRCVEHTCLGTPQWD